MEKAAAPSKVSQEEMERKELKETDITEGANLMELGVHMPYSGLICFPPWCRTRTAQRCCFIHQRKPLAEE
ncbi:hypothetical protein SRHO_G00227010 [Serrasalmus rhombeus]